MYAQQIINQNLSAIQPSIKIKKGKVEKEIKFELRELSISQAQEFKDYMDNKINLDVYEGTCEKNKEKVRIEFKEGESLSIEDKIIIKNERIMGRYNYVYWAERYYKIINHENLWINYKENTSQRINTRIFARQELKRVALRKFSLKARQGGETTDSQGRILHRINHFPDAQALISSHMDKETFVMSQKFTGSLDKLPYWYRVFRKKHETGSFYDFDNKAFLDLGYGTQDSIGRGRTPTLYHGSEIPFYANPQKSLEEGLFRAMHENVYMLQILEGTAEVRKDWFHKKWKEFVEGMEKGTTSMIPVFHPWVYRTDIYPTKEWLRARSNAFANWLPSKETLALARAIENWIKTNPDAVAELGSNYTVPLEQLFYYETEKAAAEKNNELHKFLKEMPSTPDQAFQHAGHTMYPIKIILAMGEEANKKTPEVYKLRGPSDEISPTLFPTSDELHDSGQVINIKCRWTESVAPADYQLVRVKFEGWDRFDPVNKILIWEHPDDRESSRYVMSADTSDGLGRLVSDNAVLEILKEETMFENCLQVCEFASPELPQNMLWPFSLALATYYSPYEQLLFAPEINKGTELLNAMVNHGWSNIFKMIDPSKLGQDISAIKKFGFETNNKTRPALLEHLNSFIIGQWISIFSLAAIDEIKDLEKIRGTTARLGFINEKISGGDHDDRVIALGIALFAMHRDALIGLQKKTWEERIRNENSIITYGVFKDPFDTNEEWRYNEDSEDWDGSDNLIEVGEEF